MSILDTKEPEITFDILGGYIHTLQIKAQDKNIDSMILQIFCSLHLKTNGYPHKRRGLQHWLLADDENFDSN